MNTEKKHVFISYSRDDYKNKDNIVKPGNVISEIKKVFDAANITYWIDEEGVYSGDEYVPIISKAIKMCDVFLFVSSENSNASEWTSSEIAAARMYKKKIIPLRLDESPYNDSIILYVAHLDFLDYRKNPQNALSTLVKSVQTYIETQKKEEERRNAEIESQKRKKEEEQKRLIGEIELQAEELENDEREAELKRRRLLQSVQNVESESERNRLTELINSKGSIQRRYAQEIKDLKEKSDELNSKKTALEQLVETLTNRPYVAPEFQELHPTRIKLIIGMGGLLIGLFWGALAGAHAYRLFQKPQPDVEQLESIPFNDEVVEDFDSIGGKELTLDLTEEAERSDSAYLKQYEIWEKSRLRSDKYREFYEHLENNEWNYFIDEGSIQPTNRVWISIIKLYKDKKTRGKRNSDKYLDSLQRQMSEDAKAGQVNINRYFYLFEQIEIMESYGYDGY